MDTVNVDLKSLAISYSDFALQQHHQEGNIVAYETRSVSRRPAMIVAVRHGAQARDRKACAATERGSDRWRSTMSVHFPEKFTLTGIGVTGFACAALTALFLAAVLDKAF